MNIWHTQLLKEEFTATKAEKDVRSFNDYRKLETRLFDELDNKIYAHVDTGPAHLLNRFSAGSRADPRQRKPNWNRSFEWEHPSPKGAILLLHGMSDSPYSLRALGATLNTDGYHVLALRMPGHGTAPSGLRHLHWQDMAAATELGMRHLAAQPELPLHIIGYSTGASLALNYTLTALTDTQQPRVASLVLISPAVRVHSLSRLAGVKDALSIVPGLAEWAYMPVMKEFDPYKYNSFATNAASQVYKLTNEIGRKLETLSPTAAARMPPILVLKSAVDSTVSNGAVVDHLLSALPRHHHELVLFDINRNAAVTSTLLVDDPGPLTARLEADGALPFAVTFVTNENPNSVNLIARYKPPQSLHPSKTETLDLAWPTGLVSLSHVALTFPPNDPLYGNDAPINESEIFLGDMAIKGELGLIKLPADWLLRLRYNPFYRYLEERTLAWISDNNVKLTAKP